MSRRLVSEMPSYMLFSASAMIRSPSTSSRPTQASLDDGAQALDVERCARAVGQRDATADRLRRFLRPACVRRGRAHGCRDTARSRARLCVRRNASAPARPGPGCLRCAACRPTGIVRSNVAVIWSTRLRTSSRMRDDAAAVPPSTARKALVMATAILLSSYGTTSAVAFDHAQLTRRGRRDRRGMAAGRGLRILCATLVR